MIQSLECCPSTKESVHLSGRNYHQTTSYTCGPALVMILMNYYGLLNANKMNRQEELRIASEMGTTQDGTSFWQLTSWLRKQGLSVESGHHVTTDLIIENIKNKTPVIVVLNNHWLLAKGYHKGNTSDEDIIDFADTCCSITVISRKVLESMGHEASMSRFNKSYSGAYIIVRKR